MIRTNDLDRSANLRLLRSAVRVMCDGRYNTAARDLLAQILDTEELPEAAADVRAWPDRDDTGPEEGWVLAALGEYCRAEARRLAAWLAEHALPSKDRKAVPG